MCYNASVLVLCFTRVEVLVPFYVRVDKYGNGFRIFFCANLAQWMA